VKYFFDTSIIIDVLSKEPEATQMLEDILRDEESELFINRLVLVESLRTIPIKNANIFKEAEKVLELFQKADINPVIYSKAIEFSRFCKSKGINLKGKCEAIDFLHFMTAEYYDLAMVTNDKDFDKLNKVYKEWLSS